jgi:tRNA pseudouridine13 synthase
MLEHQHLAVLWVDLHANKLRRGHLVGNRFSIRIRDVDMSAAVRAQRVLDRLSRDGLPNGFGPQRFGILGRNHLIGRALFANDCEAATRAMLGLDISNPDTDAAFDAARQHFARDRIPDARDALPFHWRAERVVLSALARGETSREAWGRVEPMTRGLYYSAFQAAVFNRVLARRVEEGTLSKVLIDDVVMWPTSRKTARADASNIVDLQREADTLQVSPSGPLWGSTMKRAAGEIDRLEIESLAEWALSPEALAACQDSRCEMVGGTRRPLRVHVSDVQVEGGTDEHGPFVRCAFDLPRGAFATAVMREIMKMDLDGSAETIDDE